MRNKFWYLVSQSFKRKTKSKWFIIANVVLLISMIAICNIDQIVHFFGGEFKEKKEIIVIDETGYSYDTFYASMQNLNSLLGMDYETEITRSTEPKETLQRKIENTKQILLVLTNDEKEYLKVSMITDSSIDTGYYQYLYQVLNNVKTEITLAKSGIDPALYNQISAGLKIDRVIIDETKSSDIEATSMIMGTIMPTLILPFIFLVIFLIQMIATEINEEKSSRSMEIIISNVSPKVHFFSKIVAGNAFVLLQSVLLFVYGGIALLIRNMISPASVNGEMEGIVKEAVSMIQTSGVLDQFIYFIPLTLILIFLSFIAYSLVAGILASMTVSMEDFQQIQTPIMFISMTAYFLSMLSGFFQGSLIIRILSYVPFISCLLSPALFVTNQIGLFDVFISIGVLCLTIYFLIKHGLKIYKVGILNYETDRMWRRIFRAASTKD